MCAIVRHACETLGVGCSSQQGADFFNALLLKLMDDLQRAINARKRKAATAEERQWWDRMKDELLDSPEATQ